ncbi:MAG: DNA-3-methyladenine glycosylase [Synergistaceae bacterium]|nr:DNA-3-methyladenine glycosylase [Synergistaceae bacterium]
MKLGFEFFSRPAFEVAPELLGKLLCRKLNGNMIKLRITETECYYGEDDSACHAYKGKTKRTWIMYENGGRAYIYLCYGVHNMLNIVTGEKGFPEAVLIRGAGEFDGPGKLSKAMKIDRSLNGINLIDSDNLWIEDDGSWKKYPFKTDRRVGIAYAQEADRNRLWRFIMIPS